MNSTAFKRLSFEELSAFEPLLKSGWLVEKREMKDDPSLLAIGALEDGKPIGIALAHLLPEHRMANLTNLAAADYPLVGRQLLEEMERELSTMKMRMFLAVYPSKNIIDPLLSECGWEGPQVVMFTCYFVSHQFSPPWYIRPYRLPKGFSYFPWKELTPQEELSIRALWNRGDIAQEVYPFYEETHFEANSLGLRYQGKVVGWCLTESSAPQTLWYSKLYVDPPYRTSGLAIQMLAASILQHDHVRFPQVFFKINIVQSPMRWLRFVRKRLIPFADKVTEYYQKWHSLP